MQYLEVALLAGIFWRMGGFNESLKVMQGRMQIFNRRLTKMEEQINEF